jgi:hypothetical protein
LTFLLIGGAATVVAFVGLMLGFAKYWGLDSIDGPPPDTFPVLVAQPGPLCTVILWRDLEAARMHTPEWSYLVPIPELSACKDQLRPEASIEIEPAAGDRQRITVTHSPGGDEVNTSTYLAAPGAIEAMSHQRYFGPLVALVAAAAAALFGAIVGAFGVRFYNRRYRQTARPLDDG